MASTFLVLGIVSEICWAMMTGELIPKQLPFMSLVRVSCVVPVLPPWLWVWLNFVPISKPGATQAWEYKVSYRVHRTHSKGAICGLLGRSGTDPSHRAVL